MAKHEFGIMQQDPVPGIRFDKYEPWEYDCITVHDDYIEPLLGALSKSDFFYHTLDVPGKGLAYCGITLIPPASVDSFVSMISDTPELSELKQLLLQAKTENKFIIHFGI